MITIYTTKQVAELLQINEVTVRRYIRSGKLKASRLGKDYRILQKDVVELLERTKTK